MKAVTMSLVLIFSFFTYSTSGYSETLYGEVRAVNENQKTIQFHPNSPDAPREPMTLRVGDGAVLGGLDSLEELEVGDLIRVEIDDDATDTAEPRFVENLQIQESEVYEYDAQYSTSEKFGRGVINVVTSPVEIPRMIDKVGNEKGPAQGWTVGLVQGLARTFYRAGGGLIEIVTFPFNYPNEDKAPIILPEYAWQDWEGVE